MPTPIFITGFEHGVLSPSGGGICDSITGSPAVQNIVKRTGDYALEIGSASTEHIQWNIPGSPTYLVGRFYLQISGAPSSNAHLAICWTANGSMFKFHLYADRRIACQVHSGTTRNGPTLTVDTWYRIDFKMYCGDSTGIIDWQVDGNAQTQATGGITSATSFDTLGFCDPWSAINTEVYIDDLILSVTSGDYPFGEGQVVGLSPVAGATGSNPGSVIYDDGDVLIDDSTNPAYVELDDVPMDGGTDYIQQTGNGTDNFAEVAFADLSGAGTVNGVMGIVAYDSEATQTNHGKTVVRNSDPYDSVIYDGDMSESVRFYKSAIVTPPSGGWSQSEVNALLGRVGYSSDANPDPCWHSLMIEVDYVPGVGTQTISPTGLSSNAAFGTTKLNLRLEPTGLGSSAAFGTVMLKHLINGLTGIPSQAAFGTPQLNLTIICTGKTSGAAFGSVNIAQDQDIVLVAGIGSSAAYGAHTVVKEGGLQYITMTAGISSQAAFGTAQLNFTIFASGVSSQAAFGTHILMPEQFLEPTGIPSNAAFGTHRLVLYIVATGITTSAAFGTPQLNFTIICAGKTSSAAFGSVTVVGGAAPSDYRYDNPIIRYPVYEIPD